MSCKVIDKLYRVGFFLGMGLLTVYLSASPAVAESISKPGEIRVCLTRGVQVQEFTVQGNYQLVDTKGKLYADVMSGERWQVTDTGDGLQFLKNGALVISDPGTVSLRQAKPSVMAMGGGGASSGLILDQRVSVVEAGGKVSSLGDQENIGIISKNGISLVRSSDVLPLVKLINGGNSQSYRGDMEFNHQGDGLLVINYLPMEEYLYGVVPGEMPASWSMEALKAQAVAARTYALVKKNSAGSGLYDVLPTTINQMYRGYQAEQISSNRAVDETKGQVLEYRGKPIDALFHSCSGGFLECSQDVWMTGLDYLVPKTDPYDHNDVQYNWSVNYTQEQLVNQVNKSKNLFNQPGQQERIFACIEEIKVVDKTSSGARVKKLCIMGQDTTGMSLEVNIANADRVRAILGLKSALFEMTKTNDSQGQLIGLRIVGSGYGHGLGMSQYGARGMADKGFNYRDILKFYYNQAEIGYYS